MYLTPGKYYQIGTNKYYVICGTYLRHVKADKGRAHWLVERKTKAGRWSLNHLKQVDYPDAVEISKSDL